MGRYGVKKMRNKSRKRIMHELRIENERLRTLLRSCREELFECKQMYDIREISGAVLVPNYVSDEERQQYFNRFKHEMSCKICAYADSKIRITRIGEEPFLNCVKYEANVKLALF